MWAGLPNPAAATRTCFPTRRLLLHWVAINADNVGFRLKSGQTEGRAYIQVVYSPEPEGDSVFVITAYPLKGKALKAYRRRQRRKQR